MLLSDCQRIVVNHETVVFDNESSVGEGLCVPDRVLSTMLTRCFVGSNMLKQLAGLAKLYIASDFYSRI